MLHTSIIATPPAAECWVLVAQGDRLRGPVPTTRLQHTKAAACPCAPQEALYEESLPSKTAAVYAVAQLAGDPADLPQLMQHAALLPALARLLREEARLGTGLAEALLSTFLALSRVAAAHALLAQVRQPSSQHASGPWNVRVLVAQDRAAPVTRRPGSSAHALALPFFFLPNARNAAAHFPFPPSRTRLAPSPSA